jgi:lipoprotein-anchoring transpeptidase ErfK/SrfK
VHRLLLLVAVIVVGLSSLVTAATGAGRTAEPTTVQLQPSDGATQVNPTAPVAVAVTKGTLERVALTGPDGKQVTGSLSADRTSWKAEEPLSYAKTYRWSGSATGPGGTAVPIGGTLTTVVPGKVERGVINIGDGRTVGIAAPVEIQFLGKVIDKAAAQRALNLSTSTPTEGAWGWLPDSPDGSRIHWRPRQYWQPGTTVTVSAKLYGVAYGGGAYGAADASSTFTIGRAQVVKADVNSHRMVVIRNGVPVADYEASYGLDADPARNTRSGVHVVTERFTDKRMTSQQYGYDVVEKWAVRISNNGEFIHANPATIGVQGSANVSHGCVNLSTADAKAFYDGVLYGDPVEVTGSGVPLAAADGDVYDWTFSWSQWQQLSAL